MAAHRFRLSAGLCLSAILTAVTGSPAAATKSSQPEKAISPFNLSVYSYNFNTVLYWNYSRTTITPYFSVEIKDVSGEWTVIESCRKISDQHCTLSDMITDPFKNKKVQVKALVGPKESAYTRIEFSLTEDGIIGPPRLNASIEDGTIYLDIWHPKIHGKKSIKEYGRIEYQVYFGNITEATDYCDDEACSADFPLSGDGVYCFSAKLFMSDLPMKMEKSEERCIEFAEPSIQPPDEDSTRTVKIIVIVVAIVVGLILIFVGIFVLWTKARDMLPQSLSSVMPHFHPQTQSSTGYDHVSTHPIESPVEEVTCLKGEVKDDNMSAESGSNGSTDPGYHSSMTENEQKEEENNDESKNGTYFRADSSNSDASNSTVAAESEKEEDVPKQEPEPPKDVKPMTFTSGYDKPHCII